MSKSDPFAVLSIKCDKDVTWLHVGQTETIMNDLNPDFVRSFFVNYYFEKNQSLQVQIFDHDDASP